MKMTQKIDIQLYTASDGVSPFISWLERLKDKTVRYRIKERLDRVALGNLGDHKHLSDGVSELRFNVGSGYRVYYSRQGEIIVLLLCGGDKHSQKEDIKQAKKYLKDYLIGGPHDQKH